MNTDGINAAVDTVLPKRKHSRCSFVDGMIALYT